MVHEPRSSRVPTEVKHICLVEDDADLRDLFLQLIHQETPHHALAVMTAEEALHIAPVVRPHLFLVNYQLPGMNGLQFYDQLQAREEVAGTPVILVSANLPTQELAKRHILGLQKPFDLSQLLDMIETVLA
jgi:DNA-binding response OmpR family regulator